MRAAKLCTARHPQGGQQKGPAAAPGQGAVFWPSRSSRGRDGLSPPGLLESRCLKRFKAICLVVFLLKDAQKWLLWRLQGELAEVCAEGGLIH